MHNLLPSLLYSFKPLLLLSQYIIVRLIHVFLPWQIENARIEYILVFPAPYRPHRRHPAHIPNPLPHQCIVWLPNANSCISLLEGFLWPKPPYPPLWQTRNEDESMPPENILISWLMGADIQYPSFCCLWAEQLRRVCDAELLTG